MKLYQKLLLMDELEEFVQVFVYGTLKPGEANYQSYCAGRVVEAKRAIAFGQLFALPFGYPAMIAGNYLVRGYVLSFTNETIFQDLDWLEDYDPHRLEAENEYNRQKIETYSLELKPLGLAWVYLMTPKRVKSCNGVFLPFGWWSSCE